jgi:hypothetical protein
MPAMALSSAAVISPAKPLAEAAVLDGQPRCGRGLADCLPTGGFFGYRPQ